MVSRSVPEALSNLARRIKELERASTRPKGRGVNTDPIFISPESPGYRYIGATTLAGPILPSGQNVVVRKNHVPNSSIETAISGWVGVSNCNIIRSSSVSLYGSWSMRVETTSTANAAVDSGAYSNTPILITAGRTYTMSAYVYAAHASSNFRIDHGFVNSAGSGMGYVVGVSKATRVGEWIRITKTAVAPAGAVRLRMVFQIEGNAAGRHHYIDGIMAEEALEIGEYFDGVNNSDPDLTPRWEGTAYNSTSVLEGRGVRDLVDGAGRTDCIISNGPAPYNIPRIRVIPNYQAITSSVTYASYEMTTVAGRKYVARGKLTLLKELEGALDTSAGLSIAVNGSSTRLATSEPAPNEVGTHDVEVEFTAIGASSQVLFMNGASWGNGEVYWSEIGVFDRNETVQVERIPFGAKWLKTGANGAIAQALTWDRNSWSPVGGGG